MSTTKTALQGALLLDFTGTAAGVKSLPKFSEEFSELIRADQKPHAVVVIDRIAGGELKGPAVVRDHLNLTGHSPLCGPNHPCGDRFPVVQGVYVEDVLPELPRVVVAGVVHGIEASAEDMKVVRELGAEAACYNIVPAMIVAAHAKCKVLAIVVQDKVSPELVAQLKALVGETK